MLGHSCRMNTGSFTSSVLIQVPPLVVLQLPDILKVTFVSCVAAQLTKSWVFSKEALGAATGMSVAPLKRGKKSIWKVIVFSIWCPV